MAAVGSAIAMINPQLIQPVVDREDSIKHQNRSGLNTG